MSKIGQNYVLNKNTEEHIKETAYVEATRDLGIVLLAEMKPDVPLTVMLRKEEYTHDMLDHIHYSLWLDVERVEKE